ncbi:disintegrin and metalloproteinase domain-containing protein 28 [Megalobrama amblycephala]|uniref:disintegrin and metalloproteinase domain-containing protein 28 n=1 Tax=Megalobrama amblycephala TaxID=75352 RepID=UPI0020146408|nr:disintegrin and metalloproteinase domain-containing protein 28 [Megalobrama amblycephala]
MARRHLMLWIFTLCVLLNPSVGHFSELDGKKVYEIVRPIKLHELQKRDLKSRSDTVKYAMTLGGRDIEMHLQKNDGMLTKDYSETHYTKDGMLVTTTPEDLDLCYYHGKIVNDSESLVSMSTCDGLRGYFQTAEQRFLIEPLSEDSDGDHAVFKYEDAHGDTPRVCGVTNTSWDESEDGTPPRILKTRSRSSGPTLFQQQKYIEFFLVADNREYKNFGSDLEKLRKRIFEIINFINSVYKEINTFVALTGFEVWTDSDKITVSSAAGATLDGFSKWRNSELVKRKKHDNAQLLSAIDLDGSTVGLAYIGTLCGGLSTGIVQDHNTNAIAVGATLAHEMGHNLGMSHDSSSCVCSDRDCIMTAALSYFIPKHFSSCSTGTYADYLNNRNPECLLNKPEPKELIQPAVCGNGFVEIGEECDCGTVQECTNPCCNATTCKLTEGSQCATGECCENCKIMPTSHVCRPKNDDCDLPESCTGKSAVCPEDVFTVNGQPCKNGKGYCYNGQCPQREEQCIKMWGSTAEVAEDYCYNQNTRAEYYAYCKRNGDKYIGCQKQDVMCGKLFCVKGNKGPNYGRLVTFKNCKATFYGNPEEDYGQVDTGTKCGEGLVCNQNECVDIETAYKATNCSAKCKGHAVCDHRLQCRCEPGWLPPDCESTTASDGLSKGVIVAIVVVVLIGILLIGLGVFFYKRRKSTPHSSIHPRQQKVHVVDIPDLSHQGLQMPNQKPFPVIKPSAPPPPPPVSVQARALHNDFISARQALKPPPRV